MDKETWTQEEIDKTAHILLQAREHKSKLIRFLDEIVYVTVLMVAIIINLVLSVVLIPLMVAFHGAILYSLVILLATSFGFLFEVLLRDIESLQLRHHLVNALVIPTIAIVNIFAVSIAEIRFEKSLGLAAEHDPLIIAFVYAFFFILPYVYKRIIAPKRRFI